MTPHPIELQIQKADTAFLQKDIDSLIGIYSDDAMLLIEPGKSVTGIQNIREAFETISEQFSQTLKVNRSEMEIHESGNTALVSTKTVVCASNFPELEKDATYVFKKQPGGEWLCLIDSSYRPELLIHTNQ